MHQDHAGVVLLRSERGSSSVSRSFEILNDVETNVNDVNRADRIVKCGRGRATRLGSRDGNTTRQPNMTFSWVLC